MVSLDIFILLCFALKKLLGDDDSDTNVVVLGEGC